MHNLVQVLLSHKIAYRRGATANEINMCCVFCADRAEGEDTRYRLGVNLRTGQAHCFNCGWKSRKDGPRLVGNKLGEVIAKEEYFKEDESKPEVIVTLPPDFELLWDIRRNDGLYWKAKKYLLDRGVKSNQLRVHSIGVSLSGLYSHRIVIPVYWRGELKSIVARDFTGNSPLRYKNSRGPKYIWNLPFKTREVILSEGILKSLAIERVLGKKAAALLGMHLSQIMLDQLNESAVERVVIWPDPGKPGVTGARKLAQRLVDENYEVQVIHPTPNAQADELTDTAIAYAYSFDVVTFDWALSQRMSMEALF